MASDNHSWPLIAIAGGLGVLAVLVLASFTSPFAVAGSLILIAVAFMVVMREEKMRERDISERRASRRARIAVAVAGLMGAALLVGVLTTTRWLVIAGGLGFVLLPLLPLALGIILPDIRKRSTPGEPPP